MSNNRNQQQPSQPPRSSHPMTKVAALAPIVNICRWRNKKFAGQTVQFGKHAVAFDDKGWAPSDLHRDVEAIFTKMPADEMARKGYERLVLNEDQAWEEDIALAEDDIRRCDQQVESAKARFADANIQAARARERLVALKQERERYKAEVDRIIAESAVDTKAAASG